MMKQIQQVQPWWSENPCQWRHYCLTITIHNERMTKRLEKAWIHMHSTMNVNAFWKRGKHGHIFGPSSKGTSMFVVYLSSCCFCSRLIISPSHYFVRYKSRIFCSYISKWFWEPFSTGVVCADKLHDGLVYLRSLRKIFLRWIYEHRLVGVVSQLFGFSSGSIK